MPQLLIATGIFHPDPGGPATYLRALLPALQARGWSVRVLTYGDPQPGDDSAAYGYPVRRVPRRALPLRLAQYATTARGEQRDTDLIYQHTLALPLLGVRVPRLLKVVGDQAWERSIRRGWIAPDTDIDAFQQARYGGLVGAQQAARAREVRRMDGVIVPSHYLRQMVAGWGYPAERIHVIYNALPAGFAPPPVSQAQARAQLRQPDEPTLLFVGRLTAWKGVDRLLAALPAVPGVRLLVAGEGDQRAALERQTQTAGLTQRVRFLGKLAHEQVALAMRAADYVVLYSGYEGLSHTLLEALRCGTPVIASDKGGNPEIVRHGINGLLVPYTRQPDAEPDAEPDALADALVDAFVPGRRAALAANTGDGLEHFDFDRLVQQTAALLAQFV